MSLLIEADNVRVCFGKLRAVNDLSFTLQGGQLLGLIGPNGAGKTTLLRALAGLQPIDRGRIAILGHPLPDDYDLARPHLGFAPDAPPMYEELTVEDFLEFIGRSYRLEQSARRERIAFWLEQLWLADKTKEKIKSLSRGMRQRVTVARTLLPNPNVILLDEPSAGLDPAGRIQFRKLLASLRDQGKALIVSSHILADLSEYCTHIAIMESGKFIKFGSAANVAGGEDHRCRYRIEMARDVENAASILQKIDGVAQVAGAGRSLTFEYHEDLEASAALLARLIEMRLPVAAFAAIAPNLEEAYLSSGVREVN